MTVQRWNDVRRMLSRVLDLAPEERIPYICEIAERDPELAAELSRIVHDHHDLTTIVGPFIDVHGFLPAQPNLFEPDQLILDRFLIVRFLGKGGMGEVYEAMDQHLGRVALKTIRADLASNQQMLRRFHQEIQLARKVTSANVCRLYDLFTLPASPGAPPNVFVTMEYLDGTTLAEHLERNGPLPAADAADIALQLCGGLKAIHDSGIIHRDIKTHNIMLTTDKPGLHAVIMDLGLAREREPAATQGSAITQEGTAVGTPEYMAPEQFQGSECSSATDIYALGIVLYEMVTAKRPFSAPSPLAAAVLRAKPPAAVSSFRQDLPKVWDEVISRCLRFDAAERYQSSQAVADALSPAQPVQRVSRSLRAKKLWWSAAAALVLLAAAGGLYWTRIAADKPTQSVAVLEFENIGGDPVNQAFCDGLMEVLTGQLTDLEPSEKSLSVVPASEVRKGKISSARDAQKEFGVNLAITGSVERSPAGAHVIVNLIDARRLRQLGSHELFLTAADPTALQQGVVKELADLLHVKVRPEQERLLTAGTTLVPGAYDFYLQGAGYLQSGRSAADQAIVEFKHALERDANYALAHAGLGTAYWYKYQATHDRQWVDLAWAECRRAIQLGPNLSAAHVTLARLDSGTGRFEDAIKEGREAIRIDPRNTDAYGVLARALDAAKRLPEAEATLKTAIQLRPGYWAGYLNLGLFYATHGRYADAVPQLTRVTELVPDNPVGYTNLGAVLHYLGREREAEQMLLKSIQIRPTDLAYSNLATVYFFQRRYAEAIPLYERLTASGANKDYLFWGNLGDAYRWTPGKKDLAGPAYSRAIDLAQQALAVNPRDAQALVSSALYLAKSGDPVTAKHRMEEALRFAAGNPNILFQAAIVSEVVGDRGRALSLMKQAAAKGYSPSEAAAEPELDALRKDSRYGSIAAPTPAR